MVQKRTILASLETLPKLINGKVCVLYKQANGKYKYELYRTAPNVKIEDNFDPQKYCLLHIVMPEEYICWLIGYAKKYDQEHYMVMKQIEEMEKTEQVKSVEERIDAIVKSKLAVGDKIHIHSVQGIYTISRIVENYIYITCKKWNRVRVIEKPIDIKDFKCFAGGIHNLKL